VFVTGAGAVRRPPTIRRAAGWSVVVGGVDPAGDGLLDRAGGPDHRIRR